MCANTGKTKLINHHLLSSFFKMKAKNPFKFPILSLVLLLAMGLYNCKPVPSEPEVPKFDDKYTDVKLPEVKPTTPVEVISTPATVTSSAVIATVSADLAAGKVTAAVTAAVADVQKVISPEEVNKLSDALTDELLTSLDNGGTLPADLQTSMLALATNPALAAYMPKYTLPTVDGVVINGFVKETPDKNNEGVIGYPDFSVAAIQSPCTDSARASFNRAKATLDAAKTAQDNEVTTAYNTAVDAINLSADAKKGSLTSKYFTIRNDLEIAYSNSMRGINNNKTLLGDSYKVLRLLYVSARQESLAIFFLLEKAEIAAVDAETAKKIANAANARNTDLATINGNYNTGIAAMTTTLNATFGTCHDQGQG